MEQSQEDMSSNLKSIIDETISNVTHSLLIDSEEICRQNYPATQSLIETANEVTLGTISKALLTSSPITSSSNIQLTPIHSALLPKNPIIFPGSFNPPHIGHLQLASSAIDAVKDRYTKIGMKGEDIIANVIFEISITNPDKPPIPSEMVEDRVNGFTSTENRIHLPSDWGVLLSSAPLFSEKVELLDRHLPRKGDKLGTRMTFVIGSDTMVRIIDPKYYGNSIPNMLEAVRGMKDSGVHFIVGGRIEQKKETGDAKFIDGVEELNALPSDLQSMFTMLGAKFRVDISSSEIRALLAKDA